MLNTSLKSTEIRDELSITLYMLSKLKVLSGCLPMPDAISLHHCLMNKQLQLNAFSGKDLEKECKVSLLCYHWQTLSI